MVSHPVRREKRPILGKSCTSKNKNLSLFVTFTRIGLFQLLGIFCHHGSFSLRKLIWMRFGRVTVGSGLAGVVSIENLKIQNIPHLFNISGRPALTIQFENLIVEL
jgi:hypothetical protein